MGALATPGETGSGIAVWLTGSSIELFNGRNGYTERFQRVGHEVAKVIGTGWDLKDILTRPQSFAHPHVVIVQDELLRYKTHGDDIALHVPDMLADAGVDAESIFVQMASRGDRGPYTQAGYDAILAPHADGGLAVDALAEFIGMRYAR
ncbi:MAG TPA: hypothetical protein VD735_05490 [Candidatus Saccharimonadales bacterium]|nr:hypothetical protein [Candidatus Saccharimonadales bacterium]